MSVSTKREGNLSGTVFMTSVFNLHDQWRVLRNVIFLSLAKQCLNWCHFATSSDLSELDHFSQRGIDLLINMSTDLSTNIMQGRIKAMKCLHDRSF